MITPGFSLFAALLLVIVPSLPMGPWLRSLLRIGFGTAGLLSMAINISMVSISLWLANREEYQSHEQVGALRQLFEQRMSSDDAPVFLLAVILTANLTVGLVIKLYRAAILDDVTPGERSLGVAGLRAWLSPLNVVTVVCIAIVACLALGVVDYVGFAIIGLSALLAYPVVNTMLNQSSSSAVPNESASPLKASAEERQRVLALVEAGKISPEEGAELLTALAQSLTAGNSAAGVLSGPRRTMLAGAAITLVGFFLPWFTVNLNQMVQDAMSGLQQNMPQFPGEPQSNMTLSAPTNIQIDGTPVAVQNTTHVEVRGGDIQHGLGWLILAASFCGACLPFFWTPVAGNTRQMRNAIFAALGAGSILLLYVLSGSFNSATSIESGFILAMAGYVVLWAGGVREYASLGGRLSPALAVV